MAGQRIKEVFSALVVILLGFVTNHGCYVVLGEDQQNFGDYMLDSVLGEDTSSAFRILGEEAAGSGGVAVIEQKTVPCPACPVCEVCEKCEVCKECPPEKECPKVKTVTVNGYPISYAYKSGVISLIIGL